MNKTHKDYETLLELNYHNKDIKIPLFRIIISIGFLVPILSSFFVAITSIIVGEFIISLFSGILTILLIYSTYYMFFKMKINCKITNKGLLIKNRHFKHFINWNNIESYNIKNDFATIKTKGYKYIGIGFPVQNQKDKIIKILNFYVKK